MMNTIFESTIQAISELFQTLSVAPRLEILLTIAETEACVCHLETTLGYRQAFISQHLMVLREAGILETRRAGRYVYYRIANPALLDLLQDAGRLAGVRLTLPIAVANCECPLCTAKQADYPVIAPMGETPHPNEG